jgi:hypothetical protein
VEGINAYSENPVVHRHRDRQAVQQLRSRKVGWGDDFHVRIWSAAFRAPERPIA